MASSVFGREALSGELFLSIIAVRMLALSSATGLRAAFAFQPSMKKVCGSVKMALLLQIASAVVLVGICQIFSPDSLNGFIMSLIGLGLLLNIEHVFYEYLYATGDGRSAALCRTIASLLIFAGVMMASPATREYRPDYQLHWLLGASGLAAAVSGVIGVSIGGGLKGRPNAAVVRAAPRAMLHTLFYPAAACALFYFGAWRDQAAAWMFFAGLVVYELCHTPFRRANMESRSMNRALIITCAAALVLLFASLSGILSNIPGPSSLTRFLEGLPLAATTLILSCICAFAMFGNLPSREN